MAEWLMGQVRKVVPETVRDLTPVLLLGAGTVYLVSRAGTRLLLRREQNRTLERWSETPKDLVILHTIPRGKTVPNCSPFVLKLETYLRMTNIPYQLDTQFPMAPHTGKTPWVTLNGQHTADSQMIIQMLAMKYEKRLGNYTETERALATVVRVMMDEHFYWGTSLWRYVHDDGQNLHHILDYPPSFLNVFRRVTRVRVEQNAWGQGTGRLSETEVVELMKEDLRALSLLLGHNKFLLGHEVCEADSTVFGMLAQSLWAAPGSPYHTLINEELHNLRDYCIRMKETFWPDWDKCLAPHSS